MTHTSSCKHKYANLTKDIEKLGLHDPVDGTGGAEDHIVNFSFVLIPEKLTEPMQELWSIGKRSRDGRDFNDNFLDFLTRYFSNKHGRDADIKEVANNIAREKGLEPLSEEQLRILQHSQPSELHMLALPRREFGFIGVSLYTDDLGQSKNLKPNARATQFANECGMLIEVLGDAFVTRVYDDQERFTRLNFSFKDCSSQAQWLKEAKEDNIRMRRKNTGHRFRKMGESLGMDRPVQVKPKPGPPPQQATRRLIRGRQGIFDWSQTWKSVELSTVIPKGTLKSEIDVQTTFKTVCVVLRGAEMLNVSLHRLVDSDESMWHLSKNYENNSSMLHITLEKQVPQEWSSLTVEPIGNDTNICGNATTEIDHLSDSVDD